MYQKFGKVKKRRLLLEGESRELLVYIGVGVKRIGREKLCSQQISTRKRKTRDWDWNMLLGMSFRIPAF
jgi:hypothetical protein